MNVAFDSRAIRWHGARPSIPTHPALAATTTEFPMAKPELGTKRVCVSCGTRFYDLTKQPATCPKCGTEQPAEQPRARRSGGNVVDEKRRAKPVPVPGLEDADVEVV